MSLYWIAILTLMLCVYIALTVKDILNNQAKLNNARYEQIKNLQNEIVELRFEIKSTQREDF